MRGRLLEPGSVIGLVAWVSRRDALGGIVGTGAARHVDLETALRDPSGSSQISVAHGPAHYGRVGVEGVWRGAAAETMGLHGNPVTASDARAIFDVGLWNGLRLRRDRLRTVLRGGSGTTSRTYAGYGLVFSVPKTVSLLIEAGDLRARQVGDFAMEAGIEAAIRTVEQLATVRRGPRSRQVSERTRGVLAATWRHRTSSTGDPHSHFHVILLTSAQAASDGERYAIDSDPMFGGILRIAEAEGRRVLFETLRRELGINITSDGEIPELSTDSLLAEFSGAGRHVAEHLSSLVDNDSGAAATYGVRLLAWRRHRESLGAVAHAREVELDEALARPDSADAVRAWWRRRADDVGTDLLAATKKSIRLVIPNIELDDSSAVEQVVVRLEEHGGAVTYGQLAAWATSLVGIDRALRIADKVSTHHLIEAVVPEDPRGRMGLRTVIVHRRTLDREVQIRTRAELASGREVVAPSCINQADLARRGLDAEQTFAARALLSGRSLVTIGGRAGSGKTLILATAVDQWQAGGRTVHVVARNAHRARETFRACRADSWSSIAALRFNAQSGKSSLSPGSVIVADEAALMDTPDWEVLLSIAESGCVVVGIGDREQIQPIDRRATWSLVREGAGKAAPQPELTRTWRCRGWEEEAEAIRCGNVADAVEFALAEGRIRPVRQSELTDVAGRLVASEAGAIGVALLASDAREMARSCQTSRWGEPVASGCFVSGAQIVRPGDFVRTRSNRRDLGVLNGQRWLVVAATRTSVSVCPPRGRRVICLPAVYAREHVELDYTHTADSAQGSTATRSYVALRGVEGASRAYAAATRGERAPIWVVAVPDDDIEPELTAQQRLAEVLTRDDRAYTAHEMLERARSLLFKGQRDAARSAGIEVLAQELESESRRASLEVERSISRPKSAVEADVIASGTALLRDPRWGSLNSPALEELLHQTQAFISENESRHLHDDVVALRESITADHSKGEGLLSHLIDDLERRADAHASRRRAPSRVSPSKSGSQSRGRRSGASRGRFSNQPANTPRPVDPVEKPVPPVATNEGVRP